MKTEELLTKRTKALQNSVKYIRAFIDHQPSHVCVIDRRGNEIIDSSHKFIDTFGYIDPKALQSNFISSKIIKDGIFYDYPELISSDDWILELLKDHHSIFSVKILIDKEIKTFEITGYNMLYSSGVSDDDYENFNFTVVILNDVSKLTNEISKNIEKDKQLLKNHEKIMMGDLVSIVSHQVKQPLNVISLLNSLVREEVEYGKSNKEELLRLSDDIALKIASMTKTIDYFKNFFKDNKEKDNFSIKDTIEEAVELLKEQFNLLNIDIELDLLPVSIDSYKVEFIQVMLNLLTNGKDSLSNSATKEPKISIKMEHIDDCIVIIFKDNGTGIDTDILPKIFDNGFTTKDKEGTGIGLNLVRNIIENNMHGSITVENDINSQGVNSGAIFKIKLPL